jgi:hypothetical protein
VGGARYAARGGYEHLLCRAASRPHFLEELGHKQAVLALAIARDLVGRGGISNQGAFRCGGRNQPGAMAAESALERIFPRRIQDDELHPGTASVHLRQYRLQGNSVALNVRVRPDLGVDRKEVVLPRELDAVPAEEYQRDRARLDPAREIGNGGLHGLFGEIRSHHGIEAGSAQFIGERAGIRDRVAQRSIVVSIAGVCDQQCMPRDGARRIAFIRDSGTGDPGDRRQG